MDIERIVKKSEEVVQTLNSVWDEVGFPASVRASHFVDLSNQLEDVFSLIVENEKRVRDEYRTNVVNLQKEAEELERKLGLPSRVGPKHAPLMILFDFYSKHAEDLKGLLNARLNELESMKKTLSALQADLGEGAEFVYSEDNVSDAVVAALRSSIEDCETVKASRTRQIGEIVDQISAVCNDLGEDVADYASFENHSRGAIGTLEARLKGLHEERTTRQVHAQDLLVHIKALWERCQIPENRRQRVLEQQSLSRKVIEMLELELDNLNELKAQHLKEYIKSAQAEIERLWEELSVSDTDRKIHMSHFADNYSEESLAARDALIAVLKKKLESAKPIMEKIEKREELMAEKADLDNANPARLLDRSRSSKILLKETQTRSRIEKNLPKLNSELLLDFAQWQSTYGEPFWYKGKNYHAHMMGEMESAKRDAEEKKARSALRLGTAPTPSKAPLNTPAKTPLSKAPVSKVAMPSVTPSKTPSKPTSSHAPKTPASKLAEQFASASLVTPKSNLKKRALTGDKATSPAKRQKTPSKTPLSPIVHNTFANATTAIDQMEQP